MRILRFRFFILFFIFINSVAMGQNIDSLSQIRDKATTAIAKYEAEKTIVQVYLKKQQWKQIQPHVNHLIQYSNKIKDKNYKADAYRIAGQVADYQGQYVKADSLFVIGLKYATKKKTKAQLYHGRFEILVRKGGLEKGVSYLQKMRENIEDTTGLLMLDYYFSYSNYYGEQRDMLNNLIYLQKAKKLAELNNFSTRGVNHNLSAVFETLNAYEKTLETQLELRTLAQKDKDYLSELFSLFGIMGSHYGLKDYKNTKRYGYEAINLRNRTGEETAFGYIYYLLGSAHLKEKHLDSAEYYFNKGVEISERRSEAKELGDNHSGLCELYYIKGNLEKAQFHGEETMKHISYIHHDNNSILSKIYAKSGDYKSAYDLLRTNWADWENTQRERRDYQLMANLLNEKFEKEKEAEQALFEQKINQQRTQLIAIIIGLVFILLAVIIFIQIKNNRTLKDLNQRLQKRNNALQQFSYIASHDIKEPIRSIGNYVGLIRKKITDTDEKKLGLYFNNIKSALQQIYTLIEDVMQYTQVNQDEAIELKNVNLEVIIKNIEVSLEMFIQEKGAKIIYTDLPIIKSSSSMLFMILKNLIQNGIKFNQSAVPTIEINYEKTKTHHQIIISDNGIGIDKQYHNKIFEMFKRLHNKTTYEGSGIGLSIVRLSVEKLGGTISLESEAGKGTSFVINLPQ
jgi:signal transduction histidine kinase/tetratricopeptide (TPR) repeat protein